MIAMDPAVSEWYKEEEGGYYLLPKAGKKMTRQQMVKMWKNFVEKYPIISIEDGMGEEDWEGWKMLTNALGDKIQLVGDDLFVTNAQRLAKGIQLGVANAILIKVNQIGTLTETLEAIQMANRAGYTAVISHRIPARPKTPPSPTWLWPSTPARSRQALPAEHKTALLNPTRCCASKKSWMTWPTIPA